MQWRPAQAWTRQQPLGRYRHFQLVMQGGSGVDRWVELRAVLAPSCRERVLWSELRDRHRWVSGWQQIPEVDADPAAQ